MLKTPQWHLTDARGLFESARKASADAERCRRQLEAMEAGALSLGSPGAGQRVSSTPDPQRMAARVHALVDREAALAARQEEDYALIDLACAVLYGRDGETGLSVLVPAWWCDVLWWRYLDGAPWPRVAEVVGYSEQRCRQVRDAALDTVDRWGIVGVMAGMGDAEG